MGRILNLLISILVLSCSTPKEIKTMVISPNSENTIIFSLDDKGQLFYAVNSINTKFIKSSALGFELKNQSLKNDFEILSSEIKSERSEWKTVWGQREVVKNSFNQLTLHLKQKNSGILIDVLAKSFDDGVAFRYVFPEQENLKDFVITDELTEFNFADDYKAWWNFADYDNYEKVYYNSPISKIGDSLQFFRRPDKEERANMANTPTTIEVNDSLVISIHEANLTDYAGMNLLNTQEGSKLKAHLTPWLNGDLVRASTPFQSPWRTIQIAKNAGDLVESDLIMNLNPPCAYDDTSWIETYKYIGIWWELHIGKSAWAEKTQFGRPIKRPHGANTKNAKYHIDFASKHGIPDVLIEGWDKGWDDMEGSWTGYGIFDWKTPTDDFDIEEVSKYGRKKGVRMMMYHETISDIDHYEPAMDELYQMCKDLGMKTVKVGYTGDVNYDYNKKTYKQHHHGQYMVRHYKKMIQKAAEYQLLIVNHEPIKFTGEQRTYPNIMAREGARGQEYNAWSVGNSPEHGVVLPFTRILGGPIDYTPGIFKTDLPDKDWSDKKFRVRSTICKQLAYYLTMYSPIQMAADLPENYEGNDAFQFIKDVPTNWSKSKVLNAKIGDYYTVVRQERGTENWYLGSISDENERTFNIDLSFLSEGKNYEATIYEDGREADWETNPHAFIITKKQITSRDTLKIKLAKGGGQAIAFKVK
ncbi:glycoside hydrolase family 97 protein [Aquimarina sp. BL5]|uniref:glycoside hydrolase family 97 protein n=1 Tax=Aquimarina sp. BL5 TaxID=1714860 RepID=UPI000E4F14C9|nr:glycoside hydrolase family 97 protein [Aquimarina sp. BL5]AXT50202.1 glycoside hydrolase family 97 protein [Aquimarina sp. BL5]RKN04710.1 glycoside hydrolase family 97 protein [Aquimarina sp. BL5]